MFVGADAALGAVHVQAGPARGLAESDLCRDARRTRHVERLHGFTGRAGNVPKIERVFHRGCVHRGHVGVQLARAVELAQDGHDAAGAVHVFDVVLVGVGRHLAQLRHGTRHAVDIGHGEVNLGFLGNGQQMQDGVGRAPHGDVQRDRVLEGFESHGARQHRSVVLFVVALAQLNNQTARTQEQLLAIGMGGHHRAVARQRQAQRLGEAVHRIGREHARAGSASRTGRPLHLGQVGVGHLVVHRHHHGVDQIQLAEFDFLRLGVGQAHLARFHGATRNKHHRNVQAHRGHQHAGRDLVAIGNAHQRIGAMGIGHELHRVGNEIAAGQRIEHAIVAHGNAIVHRNGVELFGHSASLLDFPGHQLPHVFQVHMAGHKLGERIGDRNDGFVKIPILHAGGSPE